MHYNNWITAGLCHAFP